MSPPEAVILASVWRCFVITRRPRRDGGQVLRDVPDPGLLQTLQEAQREGTVAERWRP